MKFISNFLEYLVGILIKPRQTFNRLLVEKNKTFYIAIVLILLIVEAIYSFFSYPSIDKGAIVQQLLDAYPALNKVIPYLLGVSSLSILVVIIFIHLLSKRFSRSGSLGTLFIAFGLITIVMRAFSFGLNIFLPQQMTTFILWLWEAFISTIAISCIYSMTIKRSLFVYISIMVILPVVLGIIVGVAIAF